MDDDFKFVSDPNWVTKAVYLSDERLAKLDYDLAHMTVTPEESAATMTDAAIDALPNFEGCVITLIESITGEEID
jgi:hypothetical protein